MTNDDPYWTGFSQSRVASYRGSCLVRLQQPRAAITVLDDAVNLIPTSALRRRATVFADLAMAYYQCNEIEEACKHASQALLLNEEIQSLMVIRRVLAFRNRIDSNHITTAVSRLDQQLILH